MDETLADESAAGGGEAAAAEPAQESQQETLEEVLSRHRLVYSLALYPSIFFLFLLPCVLMCRRPRRTSISPPAPEPEPRCRPPYRHEGESCERLMRRGGEGLCDAGSYQWAISGFLLLADCGVPPSCWTLAEPQSRATGGGGDAVRGGVAGGRRLRHGRI